MNMTDKDLKNALEWRAAEKEKAAPSEATITAVSSIADWRQCVNQTDGAEAGIQGFTTGIEPCYWEPMLPLPPQLPEVPDLLSDMIPEPLRGWLVDIAVRACIPLVFVAAPAIVTLGAIVGRSIGIRPGRLDDWTVIPNLWGAIIGRPGVMKSHAVSEAIKPLEKLAANASHQFKEDRSFFEAQEIERKARLDALKKQMEKAALKGEDTTAIKHELAAKMQEAGELQATERRYMTQDATVEKLGELLQENPRGLLVVRDELSGWLSALNKAGREGDREFYLESWNGTGGYTFDRIGRGTIHIPAVCISIVGGIQPGKLKAHIMGAINEDGKGDDGLLQRLQILVWPDKSEEWKVADRRPDTDARNRAFAIFEALDNLTEDEVGAEKAVDAVPFLRFSQKAQVVFDQWRYELENRLRSDEFANTPAFESHISKYRSLMPAIALLFHLVDVISGTQSPGGVSEDSARKAAAWCAFLELHAKKVYAAELDTGNQSAHLLAAKIESGAIQDGVTVRDIKEKDWSGLRDSDAVRAGLAVLESHNWVKIFTRQTGGRPSEVISIHPDYAEEKK